MIYSRGNRADYDRLRDEYGMLGCGFEDVLRYFVRSEGNARLGVPLHGADGPLWVEDPRWMRARMKAAATEHTAATVIHAIRNDEYATIHQSPSGTTRISPRK